MYSDHEKHHISFVNTFLENKCASNANLLSDRDASRAVHVCPSWNCVMKKDTKKNHMTDICTEKKKKELEVNFNYIVRQTRHKLLSTMSEKNYKHIHTHTHHHHKIKEHKENKGA